MKKLVLISLIAAGFTFIHSSCEKCVNCRYDYKLAGIDTSRVFPETCGSKKEIERFESTVNAAAAQDNGATVSCIEK
jgi:NADH:ubiquinone oxidoreductase subunit F (NADH-binding)